MNGPDRQDEIARLQQQLDEAQAKRAALLEEIRHLTAHIHGIRRAFVPITRSRLAVTSRGTPTGWQHPGGATSRAD